jgi:NADH:ubiquinone oxidoreductase subunit K
MLMMIALLGLVVSSYIRKVLIALLIALELLLLSAVLANMSTYLILDESTAQVLLALIITLAGSETSIALALIVHYYQYTSTVSLEPIN